MLAASIILIFFSKVSFLILLVRLINLQFFINTIQLSTMFTRCVNSMLIYI